MANCINIKSATIKENIFYQRGYLNGKAEAETEHDKMCETCIHKVSKEDIEQIKVDAIEEFINAYMSEEEKCWENCDKDLDEDFCCLKCFRERWLKEQKNGKY